MLRVLSSDWREGLAPEDKAAIQAQNRDLSQPLNSSAVDWFVQLGFPPVVYWAWLTNFEYKYLNAFLTLRERQGKISSDMSGDIMPLLCPKTERSIKILAKFTNANEDTPPVRGNCRDGEGSATQADRP